QPAKAIRVSADEQPEESIEVNPAVGQWLPSGYAHGLLFGVDGTARHSRHKRSKLVAPTTSHASRSTLRLPRVVPVPSGGASRRPLAFRPFACRSLLAIRRAAPFDRPGSAHHPPAAEPIGRVPGRAGVLTSSALRPDRPIPKLRACLQHVPAMMVHSPHA